MAHKRFWLGPASRGRYSRSIIVEVVFAFIRTSSSVCLCTFNLRRGGGPFCTSSKAMITGVEWTLIVADESDLERLVSHHRLTRITVPSVGLEFESERTAGVEMPLHMLLHLMEQDIRDNAQQVVNTESADQDETNSSLAAFFRNVAALRTSFPWTLTMHCPMSLATIEAGNDDAAKLKRAEFIVPDTETERVAAAFAEIAFDAADLEDEMREAEAAADLQRRFEGDAH